MSERKTQNSALASEKIIAAISSAAASARLQLGLPAQELKLIVAVSGGMDSSVLLHALCTLQEDSQLNDN